MSGLIAPALLIKSLAKVELTRDFSMNLVAFEAVTYLWVRPMAASLIALRSASLSSAPFLFADVSSCYLLDAI